MQKHRCGLCGSEYVKPTKFKEDYLVLEGITKHNRLEYIDSLLEICPHCGLVREDIDDVMDESEKERFYKAIISDEYQKYLNLDMPSLVKKMILHEILIKEKAETFELYPNVNFFKWLYFDFENMEESAEKEALISQDKIKKIIESERERLEEDYDFLFSTIHHHLYLVEMYRRYQKYDIAKTIINQYRKFEWTTIDALEKKWFKKELQLCKRKISDKL